MIFTDNKKVKLVRLLVNGCLVCLPAVSFATGQSNLSGDATASGQTVPPDGEKQSVNARALFEQEWQQYSPVSTKQAGGNPQRCGGRYQEPDRPGMHDRRDPNTLPLDAEADMSVYQKNGDSTFSGDVLMRQGNRQIRASQVQFNKKHDQAKIKGPFFLREPGLLIAGDQANYQVKKGAAEVENAVYLMYRQSLRGQAVNLVRNDDQTLDFTDATYTACPHTAESWYLEGKSFHIDPEKGYGSVDSAILNVFDVPVLYVPKFYFPIDDKRHTGFLYPLVSHDSDNGFDVTLPYYINIAPNYDMTITPRIMSNRGVMIENELRYKTKSQAGELGGSVIDSDRLRDENRNYRQQRWFINWQHQQQLTQYFNYGIDYADASDKDFLTDFGTGLNVESQNPLWQQFKMQLGNQFDMSPHQWNITARFQQAKNMSIDADDPYQREPQLTLDGKWDLGGGFRFHYFADYNQFNRDEDWQYKYKYWKDQEHEVEDGIFGPGSEGSIGNAIGERLWLETGLNYRFENSWSYFEPAVAIRQLTYQLDRLDEKYISNAMAANSGYTREDILNPEVTAPLYSADAGLYFDRNVSFASVDFIQTLEPRVKYVYSPYRKGQSLQPDFDSGYAGFSYHSLWRDSQFGGYDRIGDTNHLAVGLTSKFLENDGFERFRLGVGQIFYFEDRRVMLDPTLSDEVNPDNNLSEAKKRLLDANRAKTSPLATQLTWFLDKKTTISQDWIFNTQQGKVDEYSLNIRRSPDRASLFQLRYNYRDQVDRYEKDDLGNNTGRLVNGNLEEVSGSFMVPFGPRWQTFGRWTYDLTNSRNMERIIGLTRNSCCHRVQLAYKIWRDPFDPVETSDQKKGIFFEFELLGLGSLTGNQVKGFVDDIRNMGH